jgi:hypothetical protein
MAGPPIDRIPLHVMMLPVLGIVAWLAVGKVGLGFLALGRHDKSKMPRNPRRAPNLNRGRAHADRSAFPNRGYRFISHQFQYSGAVAAEAIPCAVTVVPT